MNNGAQKLLGLISGIILTIVGIVIMLTNIDVVSFGFYRIGRIDTAVVLLIILAAIIVWTVVAKKKLIPVIFIVVDILLMLVSVILGTRFHFRTTNALTVILIVGLIAVGIGIFLVNFFGLRKDSHK